MMKMMMMVIKIMEEYDVTIVMMVIVIRMMKVMVIAMSFFSFSGSQIKLIDCCLNTNYSENLVWINQPEDLNHCMIYK